jgi:hypothetical protein
VLSLPVYEIYKVGQAPYWEDGLDLLAQVGLRATVVPHFNNAEGGTHDTSCCWVGRRRLAALRSDVPDLPVLGIDEHTALVIDPSTREGTVHGQGGVHVLVGDHELHVPSGSALDLREALRSGATEAPTVTDAALPPELLRAIEARDPEGVVSALAHGEDLEHATALAALEPVLRRGWATPDVVHLLEARRQARDDKQWALSDLLRDALLALGLVVEDTPDGQRVHGLEK